MPGSGLLWQASQGCLIISKQERKETNLEFRFRVLTMGGIIEAFIFNPLSPDFIEVVSMKFSLNITKFLPEIFKFQDDNNTSVLRNPHPLVIEHPAIHHISDTYTDQ